MPPSGPKSEESSKTKKKKETRKKRGLEGFPFRSLSEALYAALPPDAQGPVAPLEPVHTARQLRVLQLQLLHQFPHEEVLLGIDLAAGLVVFEEGHDGFHRAAGFILGRRPRG